MKKILTLILVFIMLFVCGCEKEIEENDEISKSENYNLGFLNIGAVDALGREFLPVSEYAEDKYVGLFYFEWLGQHNSTDILDIQKMIEEGNEEAIYSSENLNEFHHFAKPLYGYYNSVDEWVVRKHVELFMLAGIDFLGLDCTNACIYEEPVHVLLKVLKEYSDKGFKVPKITFLTNTRSNQTVKAIYREYYEDGKYENLWFRGNGEKPWLIAKTVENNIALDDDYLNYFYFRPAQWPNNPPLKTSENFPWISWNRPQEIYKDTPLGNMVNVSVCQHPGEYSGIHLSESAKNTDSYNKNWGRGYSSLTNINNPDDIYKGTNFEEQWNVALDTQNDIKLVFVTGWNEWAAQKQVSDTNAFFVDCFNVEFSRDIEMTEGRYFDNYYLQLARKIREYKGVSAANGKVFTNKSINMSGKLSQWNDVEAVYKDIEADTKARNALNFDSSETLKNDTGRNDFVEIRTASDNEYLTFVLICKDDITEYQSGTNWMNLFIGVNGQTSGWEGLQYVINRQPEDDTTKLEKITQNGYETISDIKYTVKNRYMQIQIPLKDLGIINGDFTIKFKACDNMQKELDVSELYINGDAAPLGRIMYYYSAKMQ
jgi:hypothetical protein